MNSHWRLAWVYGVVLWMFLQVAIILMQSYLSPTFFLPSNVCDWSSLVSHSPNTYATIPQVVKVETYDYHPPMPLPDAESPEQYLGDCAICMEAITVDPALRQQVDDIFVRLNSG